MKNDRIKQLTQELEGLDCKSSKYNLRSEQILFEIKQIVKTQKTSDRDCSKLPCSA